MGNQQERPVLTPEFLGGLIVGEGSYGLYAVRQRQFITIKPGFALRMNDLETIDLMCEAFDHYGLPYYLVNKLERGCKTVHCNGLKRVEKHLDFMLPYLTGKKLQAAEIVHRFTKKRLSVKQPTPYDDSDIDMIERLREINGPNVNRVPLGILRDYTLRPHRGKR